MFLLLLFVDCKNLIDVNVEWYWYLLVFTVEAINAVPSNK